MSARLDAALTATRSGSTPTSTTVLPPLPTLTAQARALLQLGVPELAGLPAQTVLDAAAEAGPGTDGALLAVHPELVPPSALTPLLRRGDRPGFVVEDMVDVDRFAPSGTELPDTPLYLVHGVERGDEMANWSPEEVLPAIASRDRSPLLLTEGIHWVLQQPAALERNRCFMTIGSRLLKVDGRYDTRTPALWISNGTGRDGKERRHAPKVGWCWWSNRHTWLGIASAAARESVPPA